MVFFVFFLEKSSNLFKLKCTFSCFDFEVQFIPFPLSKRKSEKRDILLVSKEEFTFQISLRNKKLTY